MLDFAWAAGAQVTFSTAHEEEMGGGKYRLVPNSPGSTLPPAALAD